MLLSPHQLLAQKHLKLGATHVRPRTAAAMMPQYAYIAMHVTSWHHLLVGLLRVFTRSNPYHVKGEHTHSAKHLSNCNPRMQQFGIGWDGCRRLVTARDHLLKLRVNCSKMELNHVFGAIRQNGIVVWWLLLMQRATVLPYLPVRESSLQGTPRGSLSLVRQRKHLHADCVAIMQAHSRLSQQPSS
jgi:hypothetical protein